MQGVEQSMVMENPVYDAGTQNGDDERELQNPIYGMRLLEEESVDGTYGNPHFDVMYSSIV